MSPNYDVHQQVFGLSIASNAVRDCQGTSEEVQKLLAENLPSLINENVGSGWEVVWGPAVWKHAGATPDLPPDNVWFVAKHPSLKFEDGTTSCAYVVAIAATTGQAIESYDWKYEDFAVGTTVNFDDWVDGPGGITTPPEPAWKISIKSRTLIANGTAQAVYTLANTLPTGTGQSSLADWLKALEPPVGSKLIFTGHSLGGALSPTLAVTLSKAGYLRQFGQSCTLVYPTAGASPGNEKFASLFKATFPPIGKAGTYRVWNQNIVNNLDVVPHGWCTSESQDLNLHVINTIYGKPTSFKFQLLLWVAVEKLCWLADGAWIIYQPISHNVFPGVMPSATPEDLAHFMADIEAQHMDAYYKFILGTTDVPPPLCPATKEHRYASYPVIGSIYPHVLRSQTAEVFSGI